MDLNQKIVTEINWKVAN